jgi:hypothetical protein
MSFSGPSEAYDRYMGRYSLRLAPLLGADVREAPGEDLPWPADTFDAVLAQLVVSFLADARAAAREVDSPAQDPPARIASRWIARTGPRSGRNASGDSGRREAPSA